MKMNWAEKAVLNNPVRRALLHRYETPLLKRLGADLQGARVLDVGCGEGAGTQALLNGFGAATVMAVDLDPAQVDRAKRRLRNEPRARVEVGDLTSLPVEDGSVDAVADFGVLHHVPDWRSAVREIVRVLKPGGQLVFEEVTQHALDRWTYRLLFDHPTEDRFTAAALLRELEENGLEVQDRSTERFFGDFVMGVAVRR